VRSSFSRLTLTAAATALLACGFANGDVWAKMLTPATQWTIDKVAVQEGHAYCTMVRRYDEDTVVTFAKNAVREGTVAFDFQRSVFDVTRPYPVTLQAGSVRRQYSVRPASNSAIIMRTGTDEALFYAIDKENSLDVIIEGESFTINLGGHVGDKYASAFDELDDCSGTQQVKAARAERDNVLSAPHEELQNHVRQQDDKVNVLLAENTDLVKTLEGERTSFREKLAKNMATEGLGEQTLREKQLLAQLADVEASNAALLRRIAGLEKQVADNSDPMNPDINTAIRERDQQIAALMNDNRELHKMLATERTQRENLGASREDSQITLVHTLEQQIVSLQKQNVDLQTALRNVRAMKEVVRKVPVATGVTGHDELEERLVEAETAVLSAQAERDEYRALLQRERARLKEVADIDHQISNVDNSHVNMSETIRRLEEEKVNLVRQLEYAKRGGDLSDTAAISADNIRIRQLQTRLDSVVRESETARQQLRSMAMDKQALESQLNAARLQLAEAQKQKSSERIQKIVTHGGTGTSPEIRALEVEIAALEAQNLSLREDMAARANRGNKALDEQYTKRLQVIEQENIRLARDLAAEKMKQATVEANGMPKMPQQPSVRQRSVSLQDIQREQPWRSNIQIPHKTANSAQYPMASLSGDEIKQLVARSQIPMTAQIERVNHVSGPDFAAFRWDTGRVYGSGEQSTMPNASAFQQSVNQYISKTQSRCASAFDKTMIPVSSPNGLQVSAVDIACIDPRNAEGVAASVLFFAHNGMFYAVAHESAIDDLQTAMDMRDKLANNLASVF